MFAGACVCVSVCLRATVCVCVSHSEHRFPAPSSKERCRKPVLGVCVCVSRVAGVCVCM